jgi:RecJ-like exonuclease
MVAAVENAILMEREACARLVEEMASRVDDIRRAVLEVAAEGIRARWQK